MVETPTHIELKGSRRPMKSGARRLRDVDPNMQIEVTVALKAPALPKSEAVPGQALTPKEFTDRYGAAPADIQAVERGLRSFGLTVQEVAPNRRYLRMSGTAAAIEAAFQPGMAIYHSADQGQFRGRAGTVKVPAELDGLITGVFGLDQRQVARRKAASAASATSATTAPLTPSDLETRYSFPRGDAAGQTIAIAEFGVPTQTGTIIAPTYFPDEVASFCQAQDRPAPNIQVVPVNLSPLTPAQLQQLDPQSQQVSVDISIEVMMDIEIVAALAPGATVLVYFASFDEKGWVDLLNQITAGQPALPVAFRSAGVWRKIPPIGRQERCRPSTRGCRPRRCRASRFACPPVTTAPAMPPPIVAPMSISRPQVRSRSRSAARCYAGRTRWSGGKLPAGGPTREAVRRAAA